MPQIREARACRDKPRIESREHGSRSSWFRVAEVDRAHRGAGGNVPYLVRRKPIAADDGAWTERGRNGGSQSWELITEFPVEQLQASCKRRRQARDDGRRSGPYLREPLTGLSWRRPWHRRSTRRIGRPRKRAHGHASCPWAFWTQRAVPPGDTRTPDSGRTRCEAPPAREARGVGLPDSGHTRRLERRARAGATGAVR